MSYQVLARKWRPATFEQMVGQSHVLHALTNALSQQRLHHAYLFSGTRGVGKTSLARLFAKGLNCEQGVTESPCGQCSSCVEIAEGRFIDLIEVDAASRTKVDDTRELLDNVQYRPSRGRYKVYLIDEVHMLSRSSFNALLKTLEEPPEYVKFLLATTDPQRLPVTVLSRCLQFNLKSLTQDEITAQLSHILTQEKLSFENAALTLLAKAANGSMRDGLSLTDQAIAYGAGQVLLQQVQTMLGSIDDQHVIRLFNALVQGEIESLMHVIEQILSFGADPEEVLRSLLELLHQITLSQFAPAAAQLSIYSEQIKAFAEQLSPEQVQLYYQLLLAGRKDLPHAPDPKSGLEMALLRAVSFVPEVPVTRWVVDKPAKVSLPEIVASSLSQDHQAKVQQAKAQPRPSEPVQANTDTLGTNTSSQVQADEADDDSDDLLALNSEQALIVSQASSQGMEQSLVSESHSPDSGALLTPERELPDNQELPVQAEAKTEQVSTESIDCEQLAQDAAYDAQYGSAQDEDPVVDDYLPFDSLPASEAPVINALEAEAPMISGAEMQVQVSESVSGAASLPVEDDILDAVLAARDSLLTDLANQPEESAGKKPEAGRKEFVAPKRTPMTQGDDGLSTDAAGMSADAVETNIAAGNSQQRGRDNSRTDSNEIEDRPPWEEPVESLVSEQSTLDSEHVSEHVSEHASKQSTVTDEPTQMSDSSASMQVPQVIPPSDMQVEPYEVLPPLGEGGVTGNEVDLKWYRLMSAIDVGGRVRQLAVNSVCHEFTDPLNLLLKPNQKHLAAEVAIVQLEEALSRALESDNKVNITVGVDKQRETPLEIRQRFHREIQAQAHQGLISDSNIQWLMNQMGAELAADSLSYAPELLSLKGNTIELIDKTNFKSLS